MSRALAIEFLGEVQGQGAARRLLHKPGDVVIDKRGVDRAVVMRCPDGCGDVLTVNLDPRSGKAWRLRRHPREGLSLYPSVWRDEGCRAHFILWRNHILWCGEGDDDDQPILSDDGLRKAILDHLARSPDRFHEVEQIAEAVDASPWEVVWSGRRLFAEGKVDIAKYTWFKIIQPGRP